MEFVKDGPPGAFHQSLNSGERCHGSGPFQDEETMILVIPIQINIAEPPADGRLPHLAGSSDESHLPIFPKRLANDGCVNSWQEIHGTIIPNTSAEKSR